MTALIGRRGEGRLERRALLLFTLALGCGSPQRMPPAAPGFEAPIDAVPPELDFVFRVDVSRIRTALGSDALSQVGKSAKDPMDRFLFDALERASAFVAGVRYEDERLDMVVAAEGDFAGMDPRAYRTEPPWQPPIDLGGDVRRYDRAKPKRRADPARLYLRSNRLLVIATEATVDSVERVLEHGGPANSLAPPARGVLSAKVRLTAPYLRHAFSSSQYPILSEAFQSVRGAEGWIDTSTTGFHAEIASEFESDADAAAAGKLLETVRSALESGASRGASFARHATVEAQGKYVVLRVELVREVFGETLDEVMK